MKFRPWAIVLVLVLVALLAVVCGPAKPTDQQPPEVGQYTPTVEALPATTVTGSSSAAGAPSFIQKGETYLMQYGSRSEPMRVLDILDDGWIQVTIQGNPGWFNVNTGVHVIPQR